MSWLLIVLLDALVVGVFCLVAWKLIARRRPPAEQKQLDRRFEQQAFHDELTKLPNRMLLRDRLERALARSVRRRQSCAVLSVDIDRFKLVNDSLGPAIGLRPEDTVARTGDDEFMVLLETVRSLAEANAVADRLTNALGPPFEVEGHELTLRASIGIAIGRGGRDRSEDVLQNADVAVHRAKDGGRARVEMFRQEMNPHPTLRLGLEAELRHAVERQEFFLEYTVSLDDARVGRIAWRSCSQGTPPSWGRTPARRSLSRGSRDARRAGPRGSPALRASG
jgi:diguanylate cyclase (GGDEF)-like protein